MSFWDMPELDVPPEKAEEMIEKIARYIVSKGMGVPAVVTLGSVKPVSYIGAQMGLLFGSAFFPLIPGNWGFNLVGLFSDKGNVEKLIQRIEALMNEEEAKEEQKRKEREEQQEKPKGKRTLRNLFKLHF